MSLCKRLALSALILCVLISPALAGGFGRTATITLGRDPEPPYCVQNPGGTETIFWHIQHSTTPRYVYYKLTDPSQTVILDQQTYPGDTGLDITRTWTVPGGGLVDGKYWVFVEYHSYEAGDEANASVTFYICSDMGNICVTKYEDSNCNGQLDPTDPPVPGWTVCITTPNNDTFCQQTGPDGKTCWSGLPIGLYHVFEPPVQGWQPVGPDHYDVTLTGGVITNLSFLNVRLSECFGACCFPDGSCQLLEQAACAQAQGVFQGVGTVCSPNPCPPPPTGACCFPNGSCQVLTQAQCAQEGGSWQGAGTSCTPNPCAQIGACCFVDGTCQVLSQDRCAALGGTYQGSGTTCTPNPCPPAGACCLPTGNNRRDAGNKKDISGPCQILTHQECDALGGVYQGDGTTCTPNPCPGPTGACCFPDGHCTVETQDQCTADGGVYQGDHTSCSPNPCPQPQACCFPDGHCEYVLVVVCQREGGTPQGPGTVCNPNPCPPPQGACCFPDGHCTVETQAQCTADGGQWQGMNTNCNPNNCPQPPTGACCIDTNCQVLTQAQCVAQGGRYMGDGVACTPELCQPVPTKNTTWGQIKAIYKK